MSSYKRRHNKFEGVKGMMSFILIFLIIGVMVYLMYVDQVKRRETKIITDPIVLTNPGVSTMDIDDETLEEIDEETGLKSIFEKLTGKIGDKDNNAKN